MKKYNKLFAILFAVLGVQTLHAETDYTNLMSNDWTNSSGGFQGGRERYQEANYGPGKVLFQSFTAPATGIYEIKFYAVTSSTSGRGFANIYGDNIAQAFLTAGSNKTTLSMTVIDQTGCTLAEASNLRTLSIEAEAGETIAYGIENIGTGGNWYTAQKVSAKMKTVAEIYQSQYDEAYKIWQYSTENEVGAKATFKSSVDAMLKAMDGTLAGAQTASDNLAAAQAIYESKSYPIKGHGVKYDYTSRMNMAINAWTCKQGNGPAQYGHTGATETYDVRNSGEVMYQEITGLPSGEYEIHFYAVANAANGGGTAGSGLAYVYANDQQMDIDVILQNGCTPSDYERVFTVMVSNGTIKYGVTNKAVAGNWYVCKNVALYMTGAPDLSDYYDAIASKLETANGLVTSKMNANDKAALQKAIDATNGYTSVTIIGSLEEMDAALKSAIADANASIAEYEKIAGYINMTKDFTDVVAYESKYNNGEYTTEDVERVRQELNVVRYNAASALFTNKVDVTGWTGTMGERDNEHWSGTIISYKDANSWNDVDPDALTTQITLPKGNYVLKVAGRCSPENATLTLKVLDQTITFHGKGATGKGIDTSGAANFSDGEYANNNNGFGWEWEFLKFSLDAEQTVTLEVNSSYNNTRYVWNSFGDITLWMDDEAYMNYYGDAINAPKAEAQALVNTKPMGADENAALTDAIAAAETKATTPEELNAQIEALNNAVAEAKAWIAAYNEAKAPLVAALERFETDYNDAENGALDYMCKSRWATAVNMAQAAAVAKDVTDSYEGFAIATKNLVAALDAATTSINEYAELDEAIKNANRISGANVGDKAFQRPQSAADKMGIANAQDVYENATADGEDVTSVTTSLNEAVEAFKAEPLNAPADGQRFNIVMDFKGWEHHGKAATYLANDRNDAGNYNIKYYAAPNVNYAQAFTFTAVAGQPDCYTLSMTDVDNNERYVCTGTVYGGNASQIRTTTDASKALAVKVIATATEGIHQLWNTEAEKYIGGQDAGFYTVNSHTNFRLQEAEKATVTLKISDAGWATLILPFNAEIPEGVKAYTSVALNNESVELVQVSEGGIKANTPYLISGTEGTYNFSGYGLADKDEYMDANELFVGTYVDYITVGGEYVLQKHDDVVAFYYVGESAKPTVKAYRCYLTAPASEIKAFFFGDEVTGINGVDADTEIEAIYTINGTRVNNLQKGLNIVKMSNGKTQKVYVK